MNVRLLGLCVLFSLCVAARADDKAMGLAAEWDFQEGQGTALHDRSGNGNDGAIHGAAWVKDGEGTPLRFNGTDSTVDCGKGLSLDLTEAVTLEAWIYPEASPKGEIGIVGKSFTSFLITQYAGSFYWYLANGGNNCHSRMDLGCWQHVAATFDGALLKLYVNGKLTASRESQVKAAGKGGAFQMGCMNPGAPGALYFSGMLGDVRVYSRALGEAEIALHFNAGAASKRLVVLDGATPGRFLVTPYYYPASDKIVLDVNYRGLLPLPKECTLAVELRKAGEATPVRTLPITPDIKAGRVELIFKISELPPGQYEANAILKAGGAVSALEKTPLPIPLPDPVVPAPAAKSVGPLPPALGSAKYSAEVSPRGGFTLAVNGEKFTVDSLYSYPGGGENPLSVSDAPGAKKEESWTVDLKKVADDRYEVKGAGKFYSIDRTVQLQPGRILVRDTFTNRTSEDVGIIMKTVLPAPGEKFPNCFLAGQKEWGKRDTNHNPTIFVGKDGLGLGVLLLDDVSVSQSFVARDKAGMEISNNMFGLAGGKSCTVEWAVYPMESGDYFDFANLLRRELGVVGNTMEGGFSFNEQPQLSKRRAIIPAKQAEILNLKYATIPCMFNILDDAGLEVDGFDLFNYPKEMAAVAETMRLTKEKYPGVKVMFHIAHSLYTTNKPERFADSKLINKKAFASAPDGQVVWSNDFAYMQNYFSKERLEEGYRWFIFYPTLENSYGKEMLRTVDVMMDQMGATGVFCDGLMDQYQGKFTYDRWDGHTVEIDPQTKLITAKLASVNLLAQGAYIEYCKRIAAKGGSVISDRGPGTLTFLKNAPVAFYLIESCQIAGQVHLTSTPVALGCSFPKVQREVSQMVVTQLKTGCLYAHYYGPIEDKNIITYMYPITVENIHSGWVEGRERTVTATSGVYGWRNDRDLHYVHFCDARGFMAPHSFITTADAAGVRTEVALKTDETAVVKKIPVAIQSATPMNTFVAQYDAQRIRLLLNGRGEAKFVVRTGDFPIKAGVQYAVADGARRTVTAGKDGTLAISANVNGPMTIQIEPETAAK